MNPKPGSRHLANFFPSAAALASFFGLTACSAVGVTSIDYGRTPYNDVIQQTSQQQALLNIVRVADHEPPLFMDVGEVDQAHTATESISGGPTAIGAIANLASQSAGTLSGTTGSITAAGSYSEAPTVRYIPLAGQALIAQVSTPITPESLANLINSDWPMISVLTLGTDRITPAYSEYDAALNAISELNKYGAIIVTATPKPEKIPSLTLSKIEISATPPEAKDNLTIYYMPDQTAISPSACDRGVDLGKDSERKIQSKRIVETLWRRLVNIYSGHNTGLGKLPTYITIPSKGTLGTIPDPSHPHAPAEPPQPPLLVTRSALGILKNASEQDLNPSIQLFRDDQVRKFVTLYTQNRGKFCDDNFYEIPVGADNTVTPDVRGAAETDGDKRRDIKLGELILEKQRTLISTNFEETKPKFEFLQAEKALANQRRFMLIARSATLPADAAVAVKHKGEWFYIIEGDDISKRTLALISQFNTIQAVPSSSPPLTPTISVGAR